MEASRGAPARLLAGRSSTSDAGEMRASFRRQSLSLAAIRPYRGAAPRPTTPQRTPQHDRKGRLMCRWLAYSGSPLLLQEALYGGPNSLVDQSLHSRLGAEPTNGDGFGVGWYGSPETPGLYRSTEPAWNDYNLRELAGHISSPLFFTHIRAAIGSAVQQTNCHPFRHGHWLFMHNGYLNEFATIKRDIVLAIDPSLYPQIQGDGRHRVPVLPGADARPAGRPPRGDRGRHRSRRGDRRAPRCAPSVPGHHRDHRRRDHLGLPVLQRASIPVALLHHRRPHATASCTRNANSSRTCLSMRA